MGESFLFWNSILFWKEKIAIIFTYEIQWNPFWEATLTRDHPLWNGHLPM